MTPNTHRGLWLTRTLVSLALLATSAHSACVSLATSKACPSFSQYSVDTSVAGTITSMGVGINFTSFTDTDSFDSAVLGAAGFMTSSTCTAYNPATQRIRYQDTVLCTIAIQDPNSLKCDSNPDDYPNMCASSCTLYASALSAMVTKECANDTQSTENVSDMNEICKGSSSMGWSGLIGDPTDTVACVNATTNEQLTCGFGTQVAMCSYCASNSTDTCCASSTLCTTTSSTTLTPTTTSAGITPPSPSSGTSTNNGSSGLSTAALGGIIGGGVAAFLMFFAIVICCVRRNRPVNNSGNKNLSRHVSNSSTMKYNISAPKIQEEGFAASLGIAPIPMTALPNSEKDLGATAAAAAVADNRISKGSMVAGDKPSYCQALYPYQASMADELDLTPGDIVKVHRVFDDGWAVGMNMNTSSEGAFPVVCVMFVDESSLEDDFEDVNMQSMTPMGHREDDIKGSQRSSLPSRASSPVNLPKRHSSMLRDSLIIPGVSAPMTSSPLAGGNNQRLQPPVRDTMMSDASSINRWWEGEGSSK
ncbi:hypothetical protein BGX21_005933 [Mortierella sp. AD011]|nr:hypothetical protein BGX20_006558 [Mortierella sp. AD010]KAF9399600.1 hypothetical protein BGX21_005933 [Mortierella sp. AD011]